MNNYIDYIHVDYTRFASTLQLIFYHDFCLLIYQDTTDNIMYSIIGPFSNGQSQSLETLELDDRVEYAKINYNLMPKIPCLILTHQLKKK